MSDDDSRDSRGDKKVNGDAIDKDSICRDFLRNVCRRGKRCKYRHPEPGEAEELGRKIEYIFCHDYQNKECRRGNCKFIHCTREEEEYYRTTGDLPQHVIDAVALGKGLNQESPGPRGEVPICKDFLKGDCRRAGRCKFRHLNHSDYEMEVGRQRRRDRFDSFDRYDEYDQYEPVAKRRHFDDFSCTGSGLGSVGLGTGTLSGTLGLLGSRQPPIHTIPPEYPMLEEENILLRRKLEELKKQVADLTATNEFLLDQNAQLRMGKQSTPVQPPVTQPLNPNPLPAPNPVPMSMNSEMTAAPPPAPLQTQRTLAQELAAGAQSIVPVSLAAQGPTMVAPVVSIAPVSLTSAMPAVSLAQSLPQSIAMTMSGPSTPLVSYPIMTQSLRPAIPQSSLAH